MSDREALERELADLLAHRDEVVERFHRLMTIDYTARAEAIFRAFAAHRDDPAALTIVLDVHEEGLRGRLMSLGVPEDVAAQLAMQLTHGLCAELRRRHEATSEIPK